MFQIFGVCFGYVVSLKYPKSTSQYIRFTQQILISILLHFAQMTDMTKIIKKGRKGGVTNYKKDIFLNCVNDLLPVGAENWKLVAERYKTSSGEKFVRDHVDIKRYFTTKCFNGNKKPTGQSGPSPDVKRSQEIYRNILLNESAGNFYN